MSITTVEVVSSFEAVFDFIVLMAVNEQFVFFVFSVRD